MDYGVYFTKDDVQALFFPGDEAIAEIVQWLTTGGASAIRELDNTAIDFDIDVESANKLLASDFKLYTDGRKTILRTLSYSIPDGLVNIIDLVSPTTFFGTPTSAIKASRAKPIPDFWKSPTPACENNVTVTSYTGHIKNTTGFGRSCFRDMYNLGDYQADSIAGSTIG